MICGLSVRPRKDGAGSKDDVIATNARAMMKAFISNGSTARCTGVAFNCYQIKLIDEEFYSTA